MSDTRYRLTLETFDLSTGVVYSSTSRICLELRSLIPEVVTAHEIDSEEALYELLQAINTIYTLQKDSKNNPTYRLAVDQEIARIQKGPRDYSSEKDLTDVLTAVGSYCDNHPSEND